jgi:hypothetical protein
MDEFIWRINPPYTSPTTFNLLQAVDSDHTESITSPIDQFISKNKELMSLLIDPNNFKGRIQQLKDQGKIASKPLRFINESLFNSSNISPVLANLVLLGHISAVESYFRAVFKRLILIDNETQKICYEKQLSYGAVLFHDSQNVPDALLETVTFSSRKNIEESLRDYFGIKGVLPSNIINHLDEFSKVCQMRHCIVHRFGILGINNLKYDLEQNKSILNKPIKNTFNSIQEISQICSNLVNEINQHIWQCVMYRQIAEINTNKKGVKKAQVSWKWAWGRDRAKFKKYFDIFISNQLPLVDINTSLRKAYDDYLETYNTA